MDEDTRPYCVDGCGNLAVGERLLGMSSGGEEVVELVCYDHAQGGPRG